MTGLYPSADIGPEHESWTCDTLLEDSVLTQDITVAVEFLMVPYGSVAEFKALVELLVLIFLSLLLWEKTV